MMLSVLSVLCGKRMCVFITSAVRPLIPAISAVGDSITQFAHMDTHIWVQAPMFIDRTLVHLVV